VGGGGFQLEWGGSRNLLRWHDVLTEGGGERKNASECILFIRKERRTRKEGNLYFKMGRLRLRGRVGEDNERPWSIICSNHHTFLGTQLYVL